MHGPHHHGVQLRFGGGAQAGRGVAGQLLQLGPQLSRPGQLAGHPEGGGHLVEGAADLGGQVVGPDDPHLVHDLPRHVGGDQLAVEAVVGDQVGEGLPHGGREVRQHAADEVGVGRPVGALDGGHQLRLGVGQDGGQLGPDEPGPGCPAHRELVPVGQHLHLAVEAPGRLEVVDQGFVGVEVTVAAQRGPVEGGHTVVHLAQDLGGHLFGGALQAGIPVGGGQAAPLDGQGEEDLEVDLAVGCGHAGRVVDEVGVDPAPPPAVADAPPLGHAQVGALGHHPGADPVGGDAHPVVGVVPDIPVGLVRSLDVGADPAEPQEVDRRPQDGRDELGRAERLRFGSDHTAGGRRERARLDVAGPDPAPGRDQLGPVVGP